MSTSTSSIKAYGVSEALSTKPPDQKDIELTKRLEECLRNYDVFESESELQHRMNVLHKINILFKDWIKQILLSKVIKIDILSS
jgi:poly(A) polymerase